MPNPTPDAPWQDISVDFTMDFPTSLSYDAVMVVIDRFSKETVFISTNKTVMPLQTTELFKDHVLARSPVRTKGGLLYRNNKLRSAQPITVPRT